MPCNPLHVVRGRVHDVRTFEEVDVSEKIACRFMKEEGPTARRTCISYKGETGEALKNMVKHDFHAADSNRL